MRFFVYTLLLIISLISCSKEQNNFVVTGKITGLKKGTLFLEKIENNQLVVIDSVYINNGTEHFKFSNTLTEPEIFVLSLDKLKTKQLSFFGEKGHLNIETTLSEFINRACVTNAPLDSLLKQHDIYAKKLNAKNLDFIKQKLEAKRDGKTEVLKKIEKEKLQNLKRLYLFSANYAIQHKNTAIAPYIAYARMEQATPKLKQKIYNELTPNIKESKYGKLLKSKLN